MHALRLEHGKLILHQNHSIPSAHGNDCLVKIHSAALNRRDQWICDGAYPNIQNATLGSDGCGTIIEGGERRDVVICPSLNWGEEQAFQSKSYTILGMPEDGTFAEYCVVPRSNLIPKPDHLSHQQAAALPLAGLTAWRALFTQGNLSPNDNLLITGIGGGVSTIALQLALGTNANVWVTSSSDTKIERAIQLGAKGGANYKHSGWHKELPKSFDVILDGAGGEGFGTLVRKIGMGGRIVFYGGTSGAWPSILPQHLFFKQARIIGSTMGSISEFHALMEFVSKNKIIPLIEEVFPVEEYERAFQRLLSPQKMGKVILTL